MAPKNLTSSKRRQKEDETQTPDHAGKEQSDEGTNSDSDTGAAEEAAKLLVPPKKHIFATPFKQPAPEPVENGSACSSPSASGFIIVPSRKLRREKKTTKVKAPASSKVFSNDDVISLLKGLAIFWANGRNNKWTEFHQFVKDDLPNQFSKTQVSEKIRSLKKKFDANSERARANGGRIDLSDPHESVVFELSKALWGDESGIVQERGGVGENGDEEVVENDEGSKSRKKRKQVVGEHGEESKRMRKGERRTEDVWEEGDEGDASNAVLEEGDVHDAANTILSIRELVDKDGEGSKKTRKKKRREGDDGDDGDEKKENEMEGVQMEGNDEGNKKASKHKQVNGSDERSKKTRKTKLVDDCGEVLKEVNRADQHEEEEEEEEEEELLEEGKQVDEHEQQDKKSKKEKHVDGDEVKKDLAKEEDDHREEKNIPAHHKQKMEIRVDDFQSAYPLLYASFNIFGPKVAMEECVSIGRENAQELEEKWREINAEMHRLELKKLDLMKPSRKM